MDSTATSAYGIESSLPKAQGETSDKVSSIVLKNDKESRKLEALVKEVSFIDEHEKHINSDKNFHILQLLKQGESKQRIKVLLNIGSRNLYERIDQVVIILFNAQKSDKKETKETEETKETKET